MHKNIILECIYLTKPIRKTRIHDKIQKYMMTNNELLSIIHLNLRLNITVGFNNAVKLPRKHI